MSLQAQEPGASDLTLVPGGGGAPLPLQSVPPSCGYRVTEDSAHGLELSVPYDGCRIVAQVCGTSM